MEDSHAFANSLQWGPDGWLYGANGSTVTAKVRGLEFQQGIWRYHPRTKEFELFAEGGGNTWGLDFDRHGNAIAGTNWGGHAMLHQVQGGYYVKGFGKHGPLHNPHTYGYFDHVPHEGFKGGHVTCGGIIYQGDGLPARFRDAYLAGNLLDNALYWHTLTANGSTFKAKQAGDLLIANDTWFRPIDLLTGPDGAVYVADWYDKRANHVDPVDNWDKSNGRVYRLQGKGGRPFPRDLRLSKLSSAELVGLLSHPNSWQRGEARRLLAERRDPAAVAPLRKAVREGRGDLALESLWALYVSGGLDDDAALGFLGHADADVRVWVVRLLGDARRVTPAQAARLAELAAHDPSPAVRSQLACTAKRLPADQGLPVVRALLTRNEDENDPFIPLLVWWAVEDKAVSDRQGVLKMFEPAATWKLPLVRKVILERIGRRWLAEGGAADLSACAALLDAAPGPAEVELVVRGLEQALAGRFLSEVPPQLDKPLGRLLAQGQPSPALRRLALRLGVPSAREQAVAVVRDPKRPDAERAGLLEVLGQSGRAELLPAFLEVFADAKSDALRQAALAALQGYNDPRVGDAVLAAYPKLGGAARSRARELLLSRPATALALLKLIDAGQVAKTDLSLDQVRRLPEHNDAALSKLVEKHFGRVGPLPSGEKIARQRSVNLILSRGKGDPARGQALFKQHCAACHALFGEGNKVGPELTGADRKNREFLIVSVVDPSAVIRPEYVAYTVITADGRSLFGLVVEQTPEAVTLLNEKNERTVVPRRKIEKMEPSPVSLMPEKLLDPLDDQQICDLFSYLQAEGPPRPE
jgi:putative heme-binding domain-containing protein